MMKGFFCLDILLPRKCLVAISPMWGRNRSFRKLSKVCARPVCAQVHSRLKFVMKLKNPLNIIWGYIDLIGLDAQKNQPTELRFIDGIWNALHRMDSLIEDALSAERFMASEAAFRRHYFDVHELIQ